MHACHHHDHGPHDRGRAFAIGVGLNLAYVALEAGFGFWSGSLALLADAGHNLSDVLGLLLAWAGYALAKIRPSERLTYGWRGSTILAALFNALLLLVAVGGIVWEAIGRFSEPSQVSGILVVVVASIGVVINTGTALLFMAGRKDDLNIQGAFLHMAADALLSLGVVVAGLTIALTGWQWVDPLTSLVIGVVILVATWQLLRESVHLAMQAVPARIDVKQVDRYLRELAGVTAVHDLHIWAMSTTEVALTAHLVRPQLQDDDQLLSRIARELHERFQIGHVTIQIERDVDSADCRQALEGSL